MPRAFFLQESNPFLHEICLFRQTKQAPTPSWEPGLVSIALFSSGCPKELKQTSRAHTGPSQYHPGLRACRNSFRLLVFSRNSGYDPPEGPNRVNQIKDLGLGACGSSFCPVTAPPLLAGWAHTGQSQRRTGPGRSRKFFLPTFSFKKK